MIYEWRAATAAERLFSEHLLIRTLLATVAIAGESVQNVGIGVGECPLRRKGLRKCCSLYGGG